MSDDLLDAVAAIRPNDGDLDDITRAQLRMRAFGADPGPSAASDAHRSHGSVEVGPTAAVQRRHTARRAALVSVAAAIIVAVVVSVRTAEAPASPTQASQTVGSTAGSASSGTPIPTSIAAASTTASPTPTPTSARPSTPTQDTVPGIADDWSSFPAPPIEARFQNISIDTSDGWFVWGGIVFDSTADTLTDDLQDGAYYDAHAGTWRVLPPAPLKVRDAQVGKAVWTGTEVVIFQGGGNVRAAAFNPTTFTWRTIDPPAAAQLVSVPKNDTGFSIGSPRYIDGRIVMFAPGDPENGNPSGITMLDPVTDTWSFGAPPPASVTSLNAPAQPTSSDTQLFFVGGGQVNNSGACVGSTSLYSYDVPTNVWTESMLPHGNWLPAIVSWSGSRLLLGAGTDCSSNTSVRYASLFDPATGRFEPTADTPIDLPVAIASTVAGRYSVSVAGPGPLEPVLYSFDRGIWHVGHPLLDDAQTASEATLNIVGDEITVWSPGLDFAPDTSLGTGDGTACCATSGDAYRYTLPAPEVLSTETTTVEPTSTTVATRSTAPEQCLAVGSDGRPGLDPACYRAVERDGGGTSFIAALDAFLNGPIWPYGGRLYIVQAGDYLGVIAASQGLDLQQLVDANGHSLNMILTPGQPLFIPAA
ncbi:MAG: hypothetical protein JWN62_2153 [Acidimicrobiales bacterium]|nr:hypothetical protein [Acidimicrobiales bacterium]